MGPDELNNLVDEATVLNNAEAINFIASSITASKATRLFTAYGENSDDAAGQYFSSFGRLREEKEADERFFLKEKNGVENPLKKSWLNALKEVSNEATSSVKKIDLPESGDTSVTLWKDYDDDQPNDLSAAAKTANVYALATGTAADATTTPATEKVAATFNINFEDENDQFIKFDKDTDFTQEQLRNFLHGSMDEGALSETSKAYKGIMYSAKVGNHYIDLTLKQMAALFVSETYLSGSHDLPSPNYIERPKLVFKAATGDNDNYRFEIVKQSVVITAASTSPATAEVRGDRYRIIAVPTGVEGESGEVYTRSTILNTPDEDADGNEVTAEMKTAFDTQVVTNEFLLGPDTNEVPAYYQASDINSNTGATNTKGMFAYQSAKAKQDLNLSFTENLKDVGASLVSNVVEFSLTQYNKAYNQTSPAKRTLAVLSGLSSGIKPVGDSWSTGVTAENGNMELRLKYAIGEANKHKQEISNLQLTDGSPDFENIFSYTGHIVGNTTRKGLVVVPSVERLLITSDYSLYTTSLVKVAPSESKMRALANFIMAVDDSGELVDTSRLQDSAPQESSLVIVAYTSVEGETGAEVYNHSSTLVENIHTVANIFSAGTTVGSGESIRFSDATWGVTQGGKVEYTEESTDNLLNKSLILLNSMINVKTNNKFSSKALLDALKTVIKLEEPDAESADVPLTADEVVAKIANPSTTSFAALDNITLTSEQKTRIQLRYAVAAGIHAVDEALYIDNIFNNANDHDLVKSWVVPFAGAGLITEGANLISKHQTFYSPIVYGKRDTVAEMKDAVSVVTSDFVIGTTPNVEVIGSTTATTAAAKFTEIASLIDSNDFSEIVNYIFAWVQGNVAPSTEAENKTAMDAIMLMPGFSVEKFVSIPQSGAYQVVETEEVTDSNDVVTTPYSVALSSPYVKNYLSTTLTPHKKFLDKATTEKSKARATYLKLITMPPQIEDLNESIAQLIASNADDINEDRLADIILQNVGVNTALSDAYDDLLDFANLCSAKGFKELEGRIVSAVINKLNSISESDLQLTTGDDPTLIKTLDEIKIDAMQRYASGSISIGTSDSDQFTGDLIVPAQLPAVMGSAGWSSEFADQVVYTTTSNTLSALFADLSVNPLTAFKYATSNGVLLHVALMALTKDTNYQGDLDLLRAIADIDRSFLSIATDFYISAYSGTGRSRDTEATDTLFFTRADIASMISEVGAGGASGSGSFLSSNSLTI